MTPFMKCYSACGVCQRLITQEFSYRSYCENRYHERLWGLWSIGFCEQIRKIGNEGEIPANAVDLFEEIWSFVQKISLKNCGCQWINIKEIYGPLWISMPWMANGGAAGCSHCPFIPIQGCGPWLPPLLPAVTGTDHRRRHRRSILTLTARQRFHSPSSSSLGAYFYFHEFAFPCIAPHLHYLSHTVL